MSATAPDERRASVKRTSTLPAEHPSNIVVVVGRVTSDPRTIELPSGSTLTQLEVTTRDDAITASVPVVWFDGRATFAVDDEVVVVGHVRRRFFRSGGATVSRTEVVADRVVRAARRRDAERLVARAVEALGSLGASASSGANATLGAHERHP